MFFGCFLDKLGGWLAYLHSPKPSISSFRALLKNSAAEGLTLKELQVGLCAMDPVTPHGGLSAQFRCEFIFHYYNTSGSGTLSFQEFQSVPVPFH